MTTAPPTLDGPRSRDGDAHARIADGIRRGIIDGTRPPGSRILQEDLAARYGASRVPVREAIRQLEYEGLLTVVPNAGAWVSTMTLAECEEIYRMRERLEPLLLSYSAPRLTDDEIVAFLGPDRGARSVMARRGATLVAVCPTGSESQVYARFAPHGFMAHLIAGQVPDWLEPVPVPAQSGVKVWRVRGGR